jgi:hypothetical protein
MTTHIKSINRKVWKVVKTKIEIEIWRIPPQPKKCFSKTMILLLVSFMMLLMRTFEQIKNIEMALEAWKKLEESFEGTKVIKGANAYILKEKSASFKMKEDKSVPDMFHRMEVNDLCNTLVLGLH